MEWNRCQPRRTPFILVAGGQKLVIGTLGRYPVSSYYVEKKMRQGRESVAVQRGAARKIIRGSAAVCHYSYGVRRTSYVSRTAPYWQSTRASPAFFPSVVCYLPVFCFFAYGFPPTFVVNSSSNRSFLLRLRSLDIPDAGFCFDFRGIRIPARPEGLAARPRRPTPIRLPPPATPPPSLAAATIDLP